jgi:parallel beta-helix repeat protein
MRFIIGKTSVLVLVLAGLALQISSPSAGASSNLIVPTQYPTIQAAVDAANPGDTIRVKPGTYVGQVSIGKDLTITGTSAASTIVRPPAVLDPGALGQKPSIIEIHSGATVRISKLTVSGPGASSCGPGSLWAGIKVVQNATLDLSFARVTDIHDTPFADCDHNGHAILVGDLVDEESGDATISNVSISNYQAGGVVVFGAESDVTVARSTLTGNPDALGWVYALEWGAGATLKATHNFISGNRCNVVDPLDCGRDPIVQAQSAGIGNGPGPLSTDSEFAYNAIVGNDVGIYLFAADGCCSIHHNVLINNRYFGVLVQEGSNTLSHNVIVGGEVGVGAFATDFADATATLNDVKIVGTSVAKTQEVECCGFNATVVID